MSFKKSLLALGIAVTLPLLAVHASPVDRVALTDSMRAFDADVKVLSRALPAAPVEFQIALKLRDFSGLQSRINNGETISNKEFQARYYPLASNHTMLLQWLKSQGMGVQTHPHYMSVLVKSNVTKVEQALGIKLYQVIVSGKSYVATDNAPTLPRHLSEFVVGINGLQPYQQAHTMNRMQPLSPTTAFKPPFSISDLKSAYNVGSTLTGSGQTVGIVINVYPLNSDLTTFWTNSGITTQSLSNIEKPAVTGVSSSAQNGATSAEETLDTEMTSGMAPQAKIRIYASGDLSFVNLDKAYAQMITDLNNGVTNMKQMSMSYGGCEQNESNSQISTDAQYFATLTGLGVTNFASSGDQGSYNRCTGNSTNKVSNPASDVNVAAIGGTNVVLSNSGVVTSETAWSCTTKGKCQGLFGTGGSGGGTSSYFSRPSWQVGAGVPSGTQRLVPDISLVGDPNTGVYVIYKGKVSQFGGTSVSAPLWNAFAALINEKRSSLGNTPLGLLSPYLYPLIGTSNYRDITSGTNGSFNAGSNYDQVTGVGVPVFDTLLNVLQ